MNQDIETKIGNVTKPPLQNDDLVYINGNKIETVKEQLEEVIKKNLPEKKKGYFPEHDATDHYLQGFNKCLSQINTSLIADEVLKVVVEKIKEERWTEDEIGGHEALKNWNSAIDSIIKKLSNLSPNKENENNAHSN